MKVLQNVIKSISSYRHTEQFRYIIISQPIQTPVRHFTVTRKQQFIDKCHHFIYRYWKNAVMLTTIKICLFDYVLQQDYRPKKLLKKSAGVFSAKSSCACKGSNVCLCESTFLIFFHFSCGTWAVILRLLLVAGSIDASLSSSVSLPRLSADLSDSSSQAAFWSFCTDWRGRRLTSQSVLSNCRPRGFPRCSSSDLSLSSSINPSTFAGGCR